MEYLHYHLQIRNDYHCPRCRQPFITMLNSSDNPLFTPDFLTSEPEWIDEWVRRRNGDLYQYLKVIPGKIYDLSKNNIANDSCSDTHIDYDNTMNNDEIINGCIDDEANDTIKYMFLHVRVRSREWCPDNIKYYISFYRTLKAVCIAAKDMKYIDDRIIELKNFNKIWINKNKTDGNIDPDGGDFYQIIKLEHNKELNLNECCTQLNELWQ